MKSVIWIVVVVLAFVVGMFLPTDFAGFEGAQGDAALSEESLAESLPAVEALEGDTEKFSYAVGYSFGRGLQDIRERVDQMVLFSALLSGIQGDEPLMTPQDVQAIQQKVMMEMQQEQQAAQSQRAEEGKEFLSHNKRQEGVVETESGLQYKVVSEGDGPRVSADDKVQVHYVGTLIDGDVFDSSRDRGTPATFNLDQVIPGWSEGIQLMNVGATYTFYIPADLAYGERGAPPTIGPNEVLIFEVELLDIVEE
ncbi:FKBP-type peptidyl-prolyl cis-trans isomerase [Chitinivibrio alkaliphilus]|uniref:Peptidyl-prolyl cis-trans isomerase n=1 Tax=Chitinivibrio alkaliphilus ACht1 TaxID=1313304 RepID=U7DBG1_9BACT|nr:FKBP-type peptidyl-prolyl cis-trans isomerase [Chitinivibrio alkaliphilus]ERP38898.1 FKBP-type peptidyl-prolyl cis-trans isomerases 1 [Chitinivibrio alkaliphilus ACht1]